MTTTSTAATTAGQTVEHDLRAAVHRGAALTPMGARARPNDNSFMPPSNRPNRQPVRGQARLSGHPKDQLKTSATSVSIPAQTLTVPPGRHGATGMRDAAQRAPGDYRRWRPLYRCVPVAGTEQLLGGGEHVVLLSKHVRLDALEEVVHGVPVTSRRLDEIDQVPVVVLEQAQVLRTDLYFVKSVEQAGFFPLGVVCERQLQLVQSLVDVGAGLADGTLQLPHDGHEFAMLVDEPVDFGVVIVHRSSSRSHTTLPDERWACVRSDQLRQHIPYISDDPVRTVVPVPSTCRACGARPAFDRAAGPGDATAPWSLGRAASKSTCPHQSLLRADSNRDAQTCSRRYRRFGPAALAPSTGPTVNLRGETPDQLGVRSPRLGCRGRLDLRPYRCTAPRVDHRIESNGIRDAKNRDGNGGRRSSRSSPTKSPGSSTTPALANESAIACNIDTPTPTSTR